MGGQTIAGQSLSWASRFFARGSGPPSVRGELGTIALASTSMLFLAAFGYALNDYYDVRSDSINKPSRPIPSGTLSRKSVLELAFLCLFVSALFALRLKTDLKVALIGMAALVWLYSAYAKHTGLPGNILVSFLAGSTLLFGGFTAGYVRPTLFPALLAFLSNLPREILKDVQDVRGDFLEGKHSVASVRGKKRALRLASILMILLVGVAFIPYAIGLYNRYYLAIVLLLDAFLVWTTVIMWRVSENSSQLAARLATSVRILKFTMLAGLLAIGFGST